MHAVRTAAHIGCVGARARARRHRWSHGFTWLHLLLGHADAPTRAAAFDVGTALAGAPRSRIHLAAQLPEARAPQSHASTPCPHPIPERAPTDPRACIPCKMRHSNRGTARWLPQALGLAAKAAVDALQPAAPRAAALRLLLQLCLTAPDGGVEALQRPADDATAMPGGEGAGGGGGEEQPTSRPTAWTLSTGELWAKLLHHRVPHTLLESFDHACAPPPHSARRSQCTCSAPHSAPQRIPCPSRHRARGPLCRVLAPGTRRRPASPSRPSS